MRNNRSLLGRRSLLALAVGCCMHLAMAQTPDARRQYDLPAGRLVDALNALSEQSGLQIVYDDKLLSGKSAAPLRGVMTADQALKVLLQNSTLEFEHVSERTVRVKLAAPTPPDKTSRATQMEPSASAESEPVNMAEVLVQGSRSLNADIRRGADDPQPYVIFDRTDIERSGAVNINDFLLKRVSANTLTSPPSQAGEIFGDRSAISLRGLGEGQTLILVDGRRMAGVSSGFGNTQPNLNGIPLAAVERIEVLPTTASAIYGGSATGGVVNVILRRGYQGGEVAVSHDNSFDTDSSINRVDFTYGFSLAGGRTSVLLSGSYSDANALLKRDRDFFTHGMEHILAHSPNYLGSVLIKPSTTSNIRSTTGVNLVLDDGTPLNSPITYVPFGYLGPGSDGAAALIANAGSQNTEPSMSANIAGGAASFGVIPRNKNLSASLRHSFNDWLDGFLDFSSSEMRSRSPSCCEAFVTLPADDARNPFRQPIQMFVSSDQFKTYSEQLIRNVRASAGLIARLPNDWAGSIDFTWSRSKLATAAYPGPMDTAALLASGFDPLVDHYHLGTLDLAPYFLSERGTTTGPLTNYTYNPTLRLGGPIWRLPGGAVTASFLVEQQRTEYSAGAQIVRPGLSTELRALFPARSQDVRSAYAEFGIPLFGVGNARPGIRQLDLQLAVRYDDYRSVSANYVQWSPNVTPEPPPFVMVNNTSAKTTGLLGVKYAPLDGLIFRVSRGMGFVPPDVTQLGAQSRNDEYYSSTPDPHRGNTASPLPAVYLSGSNPNLKPESSKTTSAGFIVEPKQWPGFRVSLDYTRLEKRNNITSISEARLLENEALFPERIQRGPNLPNDPSGWAGPITYIDVSRINAASSRLDALDLQLKYGLDMKGGTHVEFWGNGTWTLKARQQLLPSLEPFSILGISASGGRSILLDFRGTYGVDIERGGLGLGWTVHHYSSYFVVDPTLASSAPIIVAQGNGGRVPRQVLHDVSLRWRSLSIADSGWKRVLDNMEINAGIRNIFNKKPEVDLSSEYIFSSYLVDPRLRTYYLQLKYLF